MSERQWPVYTIQFNVKDEQAMRNMAILTAEWVRQGIVFTMENWDDNHIRVTLTGGY